MNNELRDPLEKVSNSLRRAVSINRSKETDLRTAMNTIQRERRRSFNTWSLKQEKFIRAKQNLVPAMLFDQASQAQTKKNANAQQEENKPRKRRITLVKAVSPVTLTAANRNRSPEVNHPLKLPSITSDLKNGARRKKKSKSQVLPPVITLAKSSQFFQESKKTRRISDHRQPYVSFTSADSDREAFENVEKEKKKARKLSKIAVFAADQKQQYIPSLSYSKTVADDTEDEITEKPMPGIAEERLTSSRQWSNESLTPNYSEEKDLTREDSLSSTDTTDKVESNQRAKGQWKKVRDSLGKITEKRKKTDINKFSMMELTKLFEEIRECRYLRVGNQSRFTAEHTSGQSSNTCKCLACAIKDKNKLKNHLSAPE